MTNDALHNTWDWRVLLVECPACGQATSPEAATNHADWHWLTNTTPTKVTT